MTPAPRILVLQRARARAQRRVDRFDRELREMHADSAAAPRTRKKIVRAVARVFDVRVMDLCAPNKRQPATLARQVVMYLLRDREGWNLHAIARAFGYRDHGTAMNACATVRDRLDVDAHFRAKFLFVKTQLYPH